MAAGSTVFEEQRPRLAQLAYRMLGSLADADDVLQEAYVRWTREDRSDVKSVWGYLSSIVVRLCIDQRRIVEARQQSYVGPWLPEPMIDEGQSDPSATLEAAESVSLAFMVVLESLSPVERAAYLLRRVFDFGYPEIGKVLDKSEPNCRQLVHRAEESIRDRRPRFVADQQDAERIASAFLSACASGDLDGLIGLLAADAVVYSDGGGKVPAARTPIRGALRVARFFLGVTKKAPPGMEVRRVRVNGQPGLMALSDYQVVTVLTFDICDGRIVTCYAIRNPEKLARIRVE
ncbi:MAG TPA: RNA polymerase sigma-70 factor [Pirellulales bacterium]|jgi:RNA polymerase sigma-70 factor (ECF subfamily)